MPAIPTVIGPGGSSGSAITPTATPTADAVPQADSSGKLTAWISLATTALAGLLAALDFQKLATLVHGTQRQNVEIEAATYDANVTTAAFRGLKCRDWSGTTDGVGRFETGPIPGRTGGSVVLRFYYTIGTSGTSGQKIVWKMEGPLPINTGDTLNSSGLGSAGGNAAQTVQHDVSAITAAVMSVFDITVNTSQFDQTKPQLGFTLTRLASTDVNDNYANAIHVHRMEWVNTGYGPQAAPAAPS